MVNQNFPHLVEKNSSKTVWTVIFGLIILAVVIGGVVMSRSPKKVEEKKDVIPTVTQAPSPTDKPKIDKKSVKIKVENGTGTPGQAGVVVKALEEAGYSTDNIKTGNASEYDQTETTITSKENYEEIVTSIKDALKDTFEDITEGATNLKDDNEFDIVIVTGGKLFEAESTPTTTPSATLAPSATGSPSPTP